jgi:hypothetical protein
MESEAQPETRATSKLKRRWLQFSTRALLAVVTVAGVTLGVIGQRAERQRKAVAAIKALGGDVVYEFEDTFPAYNPETDEFVHELPAPAWMMKRFGWDWFADVTVVGLRSACALGLGLADWTAPAASEGQARLFGKYHGPLSEFACPKQYRCPAVRR